MLRLYVILALILSYIATFATAYAETEVLFIAKQRAISENKRIFLLFSGTEWCYPCKLLEKNLIQTEKFKTYKNDNFVFINVEKKKDSTYTIKIDGDIIDFDKSQLRSLEKTFPFSSFPTFYILNAQAIPCLRYTGCDITPDKFIAKAKSAYKPMREGVDFVQEALKRVSNNKKGVILLLSSSNEKNFQSNRFNNEIINTKIFKEFVAKNLILVNVITKNNGLEKIIINGENLNLALSDYSKFDDVCENLSQGSLSIYPSILLFNSEGKAIDKIVGCGLDAEELVAHFKRKL